MPFSKNREDNEAFKFAKNSNGDAAVRVILTEPMPEDIGGPTNLQLSNETVPEKQPPGTFVGTLTVSNGLPPIVYTIEQDLSNAFPNKWCRVADIEVFRLQC